MERWFAARGIRCSARGHEIVTYQSVYHEIGLGARVPGEEWGNISLRWTGDVLLQGDRSVWGKGMRFLGAFSIE